MRHPAISRTSAPSLQIDGLIIDFKDAEGRQFTALNIPSLDIASGKSVAITGPSGSGKTTLLYALAGLSDNAQGKVAWDTTDILAMPLSARNHWRREEIGFVFQDFNLMPELTPLENVLLPARFNSFRVRTYLRKRAGDLMEKFGVPASRSRIGQLSRGEQQRLALARALLFDPPIILADEPTASLDEQAAAGVITTLCDLASQQGKTVITVSHDGALIYRCNQQLRLERGRIIGSGTSAGIAGNPS